MGMHKNDWMEMYKHAIKEPYSFLYLNAMKPKHLRIMKRFDSYLFHKELEEKTKYDEGSSASEEEEKELPKKKKKKKN